MISFIAALLVGQVQIISEPTATPTLAPPCICTVDDGNCTCSPACDCQPATKAVPASVMKPAVLRVGGPGAPVTLPPDPDYDAAIAAFTARHKDGVPKVYVGAKLPPEPAALEAQLERENSVRRVPSSKPFVSNFRSDDQQPAAVTRAPASVPPVGVARPPAYTPPPIDRDHMVLDCSGGSCRWVPAGQQTQQAQPQQTRQRRRLLPRLFGG